MDFLSRLYTAEIHFGDFLLPWGMVVSALGYLLAWFVIVLMERLGVHPAGLESSSLFVALAVLFGCVIGLILSP